jgi:predicted nucleic acid-binding protein
MKTVLVDSNVLLDVATNDPTWASWSSQALEAAANEGQLAINALIYAEISVAYRRIEDLEAAVSPTLFRREPLPYEAAFLAGKAFVQYRRRGGARTSPLADFYIGAHAAVADFRLLTRDARRYRTYFPTVEVIAPEVIAP